MDSLKYIFLTTKRADLNLTTITPTQINNTTLKSGCIITYNTGTIIYETGVCYSKDINPTTAWGDNSNSSTNTNGTTMMTGLFPGSSYYIRAYAKTDKGMVYGNEEHIVMQNSQIGFITTLPVNNVTQKSAISGGEITDDGGSTITGRGVCWSTTPNPTTNNFTTSDGSGIGSFQSNLSGLVTNSTYHVRAYAINSLGIMYGNDISFTTQSTISNEVTICNQVWMKKNLDVSVYRNGDPIPQVTDSVEWKNLTTGAWCYYNNDPVTGATYGKLYNWYAVNDVRGLAPQGWHIPSDTEWTILSNCLGGSGLAGGALKETGNAHWSTPNTSATDSSGFTALPGGLRNPGAVYSVFGYLGQLGNFWSSTVNDPYPAYFTIFIRQLHWQYGNIFKSSFTPWDGLSVRCVRD
jgi:uncharacterized protein (TIGR02145 family)